jgi:hypothetical protein
LVHSLKIIILIEDNLLSNPRQIQVHLPWLEPKAIKPVRLGKPSREKNGNSLVFTKGGVLPPPFSEVWYNFLFFQGEKPETA